MHSSVDAKGLSESLLDIQTCEGDVSYSKCIPLSSGRQLFIDSDYSYFNKLRFDESSFLNFLDLDHISSSENPCVEDIYERSSLLNSHTDKHSNVIDTTVETTSSLSWERSTHKTGTAREVEQSSVGEFSVGFVRWVDNGGPLCY